MYFITNNFVYLIKKKTMCNHLSDWRDKVYLLGKTLFLNPSIQTHHLVTAPVSLKCADEGKIKAIEDIDLSKYD